MTVSELVKLLEQLPQDSEVQVANAYYNGDSTEYNAEPIELYISKDRDMSVVVVAQIETDYAPLELDLLHVKHLLEE